MKKFQDIKFIVKDKLECSSMTIDTALTEATRYLDNQVMSISNTRQSSSMLITILSAIIAAIIGILVTTPSATIYCLALFVISLIPLCILLLGIFFKRTIYYSGDSPSHYMDQAMILWTEAMSESTHLDQNDLLKLAHLEELQFRIMENKKTQESLVRYYRLALITMIALYLVAIVIFAILHFIGA